MKTKSAKQGISVIEVLSSITIIAILAGLLFGSIGASLEKTRQSKCINNQHQLVDAVLMYALDTESFPTELAALTDGYLPTEEYGRPTDYALFGARAAYASNIGEYYSNQGKILKCPSVKGSINDSPSVYSYGYNALVNGAKYSDLIAPSRVVVTADSDDEVISSPIDITMRHMFGSVASFADGHVEWVKDFYPYTDVTIYGGEEEGGESVIEGDVNLNPNNADDFEFEMQIISGTLITRDDLLGNRNLEYSGMVMYVRVKPKGNANNNTMTYNGEPYELQNGTLYMITGDDLYVHLMNDKAGKKGKGMGKWWLKDMSCSLNCSIEVVE